MAKMIKCKTCGEEIAKSAKVCPHCGAKRSQTASIVAAIIIVLAALLFFRAVSGIPWESSKTSEPIEVTASSLWGAYSDNKVSADKQFKGNAVEVTGTIVDIGQDLVTKEPCISLESGDVLCPVRCFFDGDTNSDEIAMMENGQYIRIFGTCDGTPIAAVQITNCSLEPQ